jgi:hypothetical protein
MPYSLLSLANNTAISGVFAAMGSRFAKLYRTRAYMHHYTRLGMQTDAFDQCQDAIQVRGQAARARTTRAPDRPRAP